MVDRCLQGFSVSPFLSQVCFISYLKGKSTANRIGGMYAVGYFGLYIRCVRKVYENEDIDPIDLENTKMQY